jgi:hypothetical protein
LKPTVQKKCLYEITRSDLQKYLFGIVDEGKHRKAEKLALMLNCIFDMATDDYGIPSPMKKSRPSKLSNEERYGFYERRRKTTRGILHSKQRRCSN